MPTPAQGSGRGQVSLGLRGEWFDRGEWCSAADRRLKQQCAATLVTGEPYLVTLVARAPLGAVPRYGGEAYRAVYTAAQWQASRGGGGGGGGGGGLCGNELERNGGHPYCRLPLGHKGEHVVGVIVTPPWCRLIQQFATNP